VFTVSYSLALSLYLIIYTYKYSRFMPHTEKRVDFTLLTAAWSGVEWSGVRRKRTMGDEVMRGEASAAPAHL
jgi:hypothetical protein